MHFIFSFSIVTTLQKENFQISLTDRLKYNPCRKIVRNFFSKCCHFLFSERWKYVCQNEQFDCTDFIFLPTTVPCQHLFLLWKSRTIDTDVLIAKLLFHLNKQFLPMNVLVGLTWFNTLVIFEVQNNLDKDSKDRFFIRSFRTLVTDNIEINEITNIVSKQHLKLRLLKLQATSFLEFKIYLPIVSLTLVMRSLLISVSW